MGPAVDSNNIFDTLAAPARMQSSANFLNELVRLALDHGTHVFLGTGGSSPGPPGFWFLVVLHAGVQLGPGRLGKSPRRSNDLRGGAEAFPRRGAPHQGGGGSGTSLHCRPKCIPLYPRGQITVLIGSYLMARRGLGARSKAPRNHCQALFLAFRRTLEP